MEKVSIILPTYNSDSVLKNAIESVKYQTYENWELLIIENGKKGQAEEIIKKINDNRIKYIYQEVANVSEARNTGLNNASGEYIAFLDSDDKYGKDFLENMIKNISNELIIRTILTNICGYVMLKYIFNPNGNYDDDKELKYIEELIVNAFSL